LRERSAEANQLPTPHGERELPPPVTGETAALIFQPLMGNGNEQICSAQIHHRQLPTPHGEREPVVVLAYYVYKYDFQPLMGNGNLQDRPTQ